MSLSFSRSLIIAVVLLGIGIGVALVFVMQRIDENRLDSFYVVADSLIDRSSSLNSYVYFVNVETYDTSKMARVADQLAASRVLQSESSATAPSDLLVLFYTAADTSSLTSDEVEDLAYTNRSQVNPQQSLFAVRNGFQLRARFPQNSRTPVTDVELVPSTFFRPRAGVRAADLRSY